MRHELLYNPRLLLERLAEYSIERRRLGRLKGTVADGLNVFHIEALELLELTQRWHPQVVYDIGAHVGAWTRLARAIIPAAQIHAFEPFERHAQVFRHETAGMADVTLHAIALGARAGPATFHLGRSTDTSSFLEPDETLASGQTESLSLVRLDDYVAEVGLPAPDLIKLDVQGFEIEVLKGAENQLAQASCVIAEVSFVELYHGQPLFADLVCFLNERGFVPYAFNHTMPTGQPILQTDVLFTTRERLRSDASVS